MGILCGASAASALGYTATVSVTPTATTAPIPPGFVGLAFEYNTIPRWAGNAKTGVNPVLVRLLRNLAPSGAPLVRIGGLSTDHSWWPVPGMSKPPGVTYSLGPFWARDAHAFAQALHGRLMLGLNFEADQPRIDQFEADEFLSRIGRPSIAAMNIGNEPPLYSGVPWYKMLGTTVLPWSERRGVSVFGRPASWNPTTYAAEYARVMSVLPNVPIAGPDTERTPWLSAFAQFLYPQSQVGIVTSHAYGLNNCIKNPGSPAYPSVPNLVSLYASRHLLPGLGPFIQLAHRDGATYRVDEIGSVTCNGYAGVSNTMASALWVADALFAIAQGGVDGVNLHSYPDLSNSLFDFSHSRNGWLGVVHPIYYGALLFSQAAPAGSRLLTTSPSSTPDLRAWATSGPGPVAHVLLINDNLSSLATVLVQAPAGFGWARGTIERLVAGSGDATEGVTLGGESFGQQTTTGVLAPPIPEWASANAGTYTVRLRPASALLLTLRGP